MTRPIHVVLFDLGGVLIELTGVSTLLGWMENRLTPEGLWHLEDIRKPAIFMVDARDRPRRLQPIFGLRRDLIQPTR